MVSKGSSEPLSFQAKDANTNSEDVPSSAAVTSSAAPSEVEPMDRSEPSATPVPSEIDPADIPPPTSAHLKCGSRAFWIQLFRFIGPGFLIAMAYVDPGNLAADINQGVAAGYTLSWVTLWCSIMGYVIQILSAKLGVATGRHLAQHCRSQYPPAARIGLWAISELGIIAVDLIEVIGGSIALRTLSNGAIPLWAGVFITAACGFCILLLEKWGMRLLEAVLITVIALMGSMFAYMFFSSGVNYGDVALGLIVPKLNAGTIPYAVGAVGAIIMPHNLYLHSDLVLERPHALRGHCVREAMRYVRIEAGIALLIALGINIFIIAVFGCSFGPNAVPTPAVEALETCTDVGLGNAGVCLGARFGAHMQYIWGAGLLAAAFASTVTSTYAGQIVMTGMMGIKISAWWRTAAVRMFTLGPTLLVSVFLKSESALTMLTEWLNIIQSLVLPFVVTPLLMFTSSTKIMGPHVNRPWSIVAFSLILSFLVAMNGYLAVSFALDKIPQTAWAMALFGIGCALYVCFGAYMLLGPYRVNGWMARGVKAMSAQVKPVMNRAVDRMVDVHV